jgi:hypothetical protein
MKKKDLIRLIENQMLKKKLNEDFYFDGEVKESSVLEPIQTFDTETEFETKKELSKVAKAVDCQSDQTFYIKPKKSTSVGDIYMISDGGSKYCVEVVKMVSKEPNDFRIIEEYSECNDCIIDLHTKKDSGGAKFGLDISTDTKSSGSEIQHITPQKKGRAKFNIKPDEFEGPMARKTTKRIDEIDNIKENFDRTLNKINKIINRRNNI